MTPPFRFEVVYDEAMAREAAWTFVRRRFGQDRRLQAAAGLGIAWALACAWWFEAPRIALCATVFPALAGLLFVLAGLMHRRAALRKLRALDAMRAVFEIGEAGLSATSRAGSLTLAWAALDEVWEYPRFWIVTMAANAYLTLPVAAAPPEALAYARARLGERLR